MNIKQQDVSFWSQKAESFMKQFAGGNNTMSIQDVASLFMKEGRYINPQVIENIAGEDKQVDKKELSMLLYMLDGTKKYDANDKSQYRIEHDWYIESNGTKQNGMIVFDTRENDALKDTLANTATPEQFAEIRKAFGIQGKPQFGLDAEQPKTSDNGNKNAQIIKPKYTADGSEYAPETLYYDSQGNLSKKVQQSPDDKIHKIISEYKDGKLISKKLPEGGFLKYHYDEAGNIDYADYENIDPMIHNKDNLSVRIYYENGKATKEVSTYGKETYVRTFKYNDDNSIDITSGKGIVKVNGLDVTNLRGKTIQMNDHNFLGLMNYLYTEYEVPDNVVKSENKTSADLFNH